MNPQTQNQIAEYYAKLPPSVQAMFSSMAWMEILRAISDANKFSQTQNETLATETTLVLLGMISLDEYKSILFKELNLSKDIFEKIEQEIEEKVIKPVRSELIQAHEKNKTDLVEQKYGSKIDERFAKLPPSIREALESVDYQNAIVDIGKNEKLTTTQLGILEEEVTKIMLGTEHREAFRSNLITKLGLSEEKVSNIITAANGHIFAPIRDFFREESLGEAKETKLGVGSLDLGKNQGLNKGSIQEKAQPQIEKIDMDILTKAGVVMDTETDTNNTQNIELPGRDEMLDSIENPIRFGVSNQKLGVGSLDLGKSQKLPENIVQEQPISKIQTTTAIPVIPAKTETPVVEVKKPDYVPSFLANKLGSATVSTSTTTDHSLPGMSTATPASPEKKVDPYLEPIE